MKKKLLIGVIMPYPETDSSFWTEPNKGIQQAANDLEEKNVIINKFFFDKHDIDSVNIAIDECLKRNCDGLLIAPVIPEIFEDALTDYTKPIITFDCEIEENLKFSYFIGEDAYQGGRMGADLMHKMIGKTGKVLLISPYNANNHNEARINGFVDTICTQTEIVCVTKSYLASNKEEGARMLFDTLKDHICEYQGIFTSDESGWLIASVIEKITERCIGKRPKIITFDLTLDNRYAIKKGLIDFIIGQKPDLQGYLGILDLYDSIIDDTDNPKIYTLPKRKIVPLELFIKDNLPDDEDLY